MCLRRPYLNVKVSLASPGLEYSDKILRIGHTFGWKLNLALVLHIKHQDQLSLFEKLTA